MEEKSHIKFDSFSDHLAGAFKIFIEEGQFADVTLVSDDQIQFKVHKVILSAFSPVLKTLLVNNPHSHPLLYLRGMKQEIIQAILDYIYFGETKIHLENVNEFLDASKDLGITDQRSEAKEKDQHIVKNKKFVKEESKTGSEHFKTRQNIDSIRNMKPGNPELNVIEAEFVLEPSEFEHYETAEVSKIVERKSIVEEEIVRNIFECDQCDKKFRVQDTLARHINSVHLGVRYPCKLCHKTFTQPQHLKSHIKSVHEKIKRFFCTGCDYKFYYKAGLQNHIKKRHAKRYKELIIEDSQNQLEWSQPLQLFSS